MVDGKRNASGRRHIGRISNLLEVRFNRQGKRKEQVVDNIQR
ncbi:hypothetical protein D046_9240, partial [Vibrio parahaemolyticus V-223/04]